MAKLALWLESNGAAFAPGDDNHETARILRELADNLDAGQRGMILLYDVNGNKVGDSEFFPTESESEE